MDKRRLILGLIVILAIPLYIWIAYYEIPNKAEVGEEIMQQDPPTHNFEKVLSYENEFMGNASNLSNLFHALPGNEHVGTFELDPENFAMKANYTIHSKELEKGAKQIVIYNTTSAFVLIKNLEKIEMHFEDESYIVTRANVESRLDVGLAELIDPDKYKQIVQKPLKSSDVSEWFSAYTGGNDK